ncbi:uncharacterized protein LOC141702819 [Apium graveolens]|uniref:uncharacterized protein LOC141702819 n=1 Tax=Apium graveolens TaxID=4045 RepID=UPI003D7B140E
MARGDNQTDEKEGWIEKYMRYLTQGIQPTDNSEAKLFRLKASRCTVIDGVLFKKFVICLLQRYLNIEEAKQVLKDIHEGECGNHSRGRNLSCKVLRMGYYWPIVKQDVLNYVKKCDAYQRHAPLIALRTITPDISIMTIHEVGNGHSGQNASSSRTKSIHVSSNRLFLQMD